jgi:predicted GNAT family acetyltransferase
MGDSHPLDRPIWSALTTHQAKLAQGDSRAWRFDPAYTLFAAAADRSTESQAALAALAPDEGTIGLVEIDAPPTPYGLSHISSASCDQRVAESLAEPAADFAIEPLDDGDAAEMLALATLTKPGPFFARTHQLGRFVGVKVGGALVAMAGERMKLPGFTEVSGVCTHPDHRGKGYAAGLMTQVARAILARDETPFLHSYSDNDGANALYARMGFRLRRRVIFTQFGRA